MNWIISLVLFICQISAANVAHTYDALNRATSQITKSTAGAVDYENVMGYDLVGSVLSLAETYPASTVPTRTVANTYDGVYRLGSEASTAGTTTTTTSYTYDAANNRSTKSVQVGSGTPATTTYNYNNLDQVTSTTGAWVASFGYDVDGNRTTETIGTASNTYTYDAENRLVELVQGTGTGNGTYQYAYDYRSRRILRDESAAAGVVTQLVYSGGTSVQEYTTSDSSQSNLQVEYIRGSDYGGGVGGILYTLRPASGASFTHANKRGDITAKTNSSGGITYLSQYQAFGTQVATSGSTLDRQKSNSKDTDPTGLIDEGFRYRDTEFGFLTRDPAGMIDGPNEYCYVNQNPWTKFDPEGLTLQEALDFAVGIGAGWVQSNSFGLVDFKGHGGAFNAGKGWGNSIAAIQGTMELANGIPMAAAGAGLTVTPAGVTGAPEGLAFAGVAISGHGLALTSVASIQAAQNFQKSADEFAAESGAGTSNGGDSTTPGNQSASVISKHNRKSEYPHGNRKSIKNDVIKHNTNENGDVIDPETGEVIPKGQVTIEHKKPVVEHWNETGNNQTKAERTAWYNDKNNLTVKSKSANSSEGAKKGMKYTQTTGPNYSPK